MLIINIYVVKLQHMQMMMSGEAEVINLKVFYVSEHVLGHLLHHEEVTLEMTCITNTTASMVGGARLAGRDEATCLKAPYRVCWTFRARTFSYLSENEIRGFFFLNYTD